MAKKAGPANIVTPRQYAEKHHVAYTTVMKWLQKNLIPGAYKATLPPPFVGYVYQIPEDAPPPNLKPGPRPQAKKGGAEVGNTSRKAGQKKAGKKPRG